MIDLNSLVEALRAELQQYGETLARLDETAARSPQGTPLDLVQEQSRAVALALQRREQAQQRLARYLCLPAKAPLADIVPLLPRHYQLLVSALMDENTLLSARVSQRAG